MNRPCKRTNVSLARPYEEEKTSLMREEKKNIYNFSQIVFCFFLMDKIGKGIDQSIYQKKNEGH